MNKNTEELEASKRYLSSSKNFFNKRENTSHDAVKKWYLLARYEASVQSRTRLGPRKAELKLVPKKWVPETLTSKWTNWRQNNAVCRILTNKSDLFWLQVFDPPELTVMPTSKNISELFKKLKLTLTIFPRTKKKLSLIQIYTEKNEKQNTFPPENACAKKLK